MHDLLAGGVLAADVCGGQAFSGGGAKCAVDAQRDGWPSDCLPAGSQRQGDMEQRGEYLASGCMCESGTLVLDRQKRCFSICAARCALAQGAYSACCTAISGAHPAFFSCTCSSCSSPLAWPTASMLPPLRRALAASAVTAAPAPAMRGCAALITGNKHQAQPSKLPPRCFCLKQHSAWRSAIATVLASQEQAPLSPPPPYTPTHPCRAPAAGTPLVRRNRAAQLHHPPLQSAAARWPTGVMRALQ